SLQHTLHIAIDNGHGLGKGNAGDGSGRVTSNAGESLEGFGSLREAAAVRPHKFFCALMQHACPAEMAEVLAGNSGGDPAPIKRGRFHSYPRTHGAIVP